MIFFFILIVQKIEPIASCVLGKCSITQLYVLSPNMKKKTTTSLMQYFNHKVATSSTTCHNIY